MIWECRFLYSHHTAYFTFTSVPWGKQHLIVFMFIYFVVKAEHDFLLSFIGHCCLFPLWIVCWDSLPIGFIFLLIFRYTLNVIEVVNMSFLLVSMLKICPPHSFMLSSILHLYLSIYHLSYPYLYLLSVYLSIYHVSI